MDYKPFFTSCSSPDDVLLKVLTRNELETLIRESDTQHQNRVTQWAFQANLGQWLTFSDTQGTCREIWIGRSGKRSDANINEAIAAVLLQLPPLTYRLELPTALWQGVAEQWALAQYRYDAYKAVIPNPRVLCVSPQALAECVPMVEAIFWLRDLINAPPNVMGPTGLSLEMRALAQEFSAHFEEWVGESLLPANYPMVYAVGAAAQDAPRMLRLQYGESAWPKISLVGKGVCFDSGGLDIKPSQGMRLMKKDMGGAAHAMALARWIMASKLPVQFELLVPAVENAIGAGAFRPGDILQSRAGLSVEIDNTDAEGRLILADALAKACETSSECIIDFATLTGAARSAVGTDIAAMFSNCDALAEGIEKAGRDVYDPVWRLPLHQAYLPMLDSSVADIINSPSSPYAGAITAALFLEQFVRDARPWVHFDIMAWNLASKPGKPEGGDALGLRAVARYLEQRFAKTGVNA